MPRPTRVRAARAGINVRTTVLAAILASALAGCASTGSMPAATSPRQKMAAPDDNRREQGDGVLAQRQLIRRGYIGVAVADLAPARVRLERTVAAMGAQVSHTQVSDDSRAEYSLRVPPAQLGPLMDSVAALGNVETRTISAEDVTEAVVDAEARLAALRASRDRLTQLLERANSVQDVIAVERELARVQGDIESLEARLQAMKGQVAMSELTIRMWRRPVLGPLGVLLSGAATLVQKLFIWR